MEDKADREYYEVSRDQLMKLLNACEHVRSGFTFIKHDEYFGDKYSVDEEIAKEYLPLMEEQGYFFGSKSYDVNYAKHVVEMIDIIENILNTTNFEEETVYFNAIW
jgi:hypothetical protein